NAIYGFGQTEATLVQRPADDAAGEIQLGQPAKVIEGCDTSRSNDREGHGFGHLSQGCQVGTSQHSVSSNVSINDCGQGPIRAMPSQLHCRPVGNLQPAFDCDPSVFGVDAQGDLPGETIANSS